LSQPVTTKDSSDGASDAYAYGTTAMQGWRTNMEVRTTTTDANGTIGSCGSLSTGGSSATVRDGNDERGEGSGMDEYSQRVRARAVVWAERFFYCVCVGGGLRREWVIE